MLLWIGREGGKEKRRKGERIEDRKMCLVVLLTYRKMRVVSFCYSSICTSTLSFLLGKQSHRALSQSAAL